MTPKAAVALRPARGDDVPTFFAHQNDTAACAIAVWEPRDWPACSSHWQRVLDNPGNLTRTIVFENAVAGYVAAFDRDGRREVCYWIGSEFWGRGIATAALAEVLRMERTRPLHACVAETNLASIRVLEKCGFRPDSHRVAQDGVPEVWLVLEA